MSDSDGELDPRRARAMMLLAKALKGRQRGGTAEDRRKSESSGAEEELVFLKALLQLQSHQDIVQSVRDRVNVLRMRTGNASVTVRQSSVPTDATGVSPQRRTDQHSTAPQMMVSPDVVACLKQVRDGQLDCVEPEALEASFWHALVPELAATESSAPATGEQPWLLDSSHYFATAKRDLHADGYCVLAPAAPQPADELTKVKASLSRLDRLQLGARRLQALGWPPVFLFMFDDVWEVLDGLWPLMRGLLGEDCELDPSVFCWVARLGRDMGRGAAQRTGLNGAGAAEEEEEDGQGAPPGSNFGHPHRDFTCLDSIGADGEPRLLSTWVPLTPVTADNGCMLVVPRALDRHFDKRWAYAHMRPATRGEADGVTEVRFDLQAVRAVAPLRPGSVVAWHGNLIHWGTCCTAADQAPRVSVGFNFFCRGVRLQSGAPNLTQESARALNLQQRLAIISRSLLAYSPWFKLGATTVPPGLFRHVPSVPD